MSYLLAIDDDETTLFLVEELFRRAGFSGEVVSVTGGAEALQIAAEREPPGLVILDLRMPMMNGFEVLEELANQNLWSGVPVIVHSSSQRPADHERARSFPGVRDFVEKMLTSQQAADWKAAYFQPVGSPAEPLDANHG